MTRTRPNAHRQLLDDQLLDALGRGAEPPGGSDELVAGLAAWRNDLATRIPPAALDPDAVLLPAPVVAGHRMRWRRLVAGAGAALVVAGGGGAVAVAAAGAGPDSPLWPITRLVHPERAEARLAQLAVEKIVADARQAAAEQRYADAARLLREAELLVAQVPEGAQRERLLDQVAQVRGLLPVDVPAGDQPPAGGQRLPLPGEPDPTAPAVPSLPPLPAGEPTTGPLPAPEPPTRPEPSTAPSHPPPPPPPSPLPSLPPLPPLDP